jgi:hypothetical protein
MTELSVIFSKKIKAQARPDPSLLDWLWLARFSAPNTRREEMSNPSLTTLAVGWSPTQMNTATKRFKKNNYSTSFLYM